LKNHIILTLIFFLTPFIQFEAVSQEGFSVGIIGGAGFSQYYFQKTVDQNFVPVFQKGLLISQRDETNFGITFEVLQTQKAWEENINTSLKKKMLVEYYEFPILSSFKFGKRKSGIILSAGLHLSFATKVDSFTTGVPMAGDTTLVPYANFKNSKWDYGLGGGLGYQLVAGRNIILIEVMYSQGLKNILDRDYLRIYRSLNQNLYMNLVYKFSLANNKKKKTKVKVSE